MGCGSAGREARTKTRRHVVGKLLVFGSWLLDALVDWACVMAVDVAGFWYEGFLKLVA